MNAKLNYLWRETFNLAGRNLVKNLLPTLIYTLIGIGLAIMLGLVTLDAMIRLTYVAVGVITAIWMYSATILNQYEITKKDSVVKMNYIPIYMRILPVIFFQTLIFILFAIIYSAILSIKTDQFMLHIITLLYYVIVGIILIIPFTIIYLEVNRFINTKYTNVIVFLVLLTVTPVFYIGESLPIWLENILLLNPFYYLVESIELSAVGAFWTINRIPQDILFISEVTLLYIWLVVLYRKANIYMKY